MSICKWGFLSAGLAAAVFAATPAMGAATVFVSSNASDASNDSCSAQYATATGGSSQCFGFGQVVGSNNVTANADGTAVSVASILDHGAHATTQSSLDLSTGALHSSVQAGAAARGFTSSSFQDDVHFTIAGASATTVTPLLFRVSATDALGIGVGSSSGASFQFFLYGNIVGDAAGFNENFSNSAAGPAVSGYDFGSTTFSKKDSGGLAATLVVDVMGASGDISMNVAMGCSVNFGSTCEIQGGDGGSAYSFVKQAGITLSTDSLLFPGQVTPAPEPGMWAMMLSGIGIIGGAARRRKLRFGLTS